MNAAGDTRCGARDPWTDYMLAGDFESAWRVCDAVLAERTGQPCHDWPRHLQYIWDGRPLHGKRVLIRCYHGLGDTVQFIRFAPLLRRIAREVSGWVQPELLPILRTVSGIDRLLPLHDGTLEVDYDVDLESMELAHAMRVTLATLPRAVPYLQAPIAAGVRGPGLNVGLVWAVGAWDSWRSIPVADLEPLFRVRNVTWQVLQRGPARARWPRDLGVRENAEDIAQTAAVMRALDLVISIDSFPTHLAGALGVPTWTLLHAQANWRWMREREDSPWYPTMRLFRQRRAGDWGAVVQSVAGALRELAERGRVQRDGATPAPRPEEAA